MNVIETELPGVLIIEPNVFGDDRGFFFESFQLDRYSSQNIPKHFVQDNMSRSEQGVLRGLHYQLEQPQGKLVWVTRGKVFDVAVDIRKGSPTFGQHVSVILDDENHRQFYIPPGFAHGFCVMSLEADFYYKCTDYYHAASEKGVMWNDPDLKIDWPTKAPKLSAKDEVYSSLKAMDPKDLPEYIA